MLTPYGKREWTAILLIGAVGTLGLLLLGWWPVAIAIALLAIALTGFFRDPRRGIPTQRAVMVSPCDGKVVSVHDVEHFEPFEGPAKCVRTFMSILNVHVNRSPCHAMVGAIEHRAGKFVTALNPESAEVNEANLVVLLHPARRTPIAAMRQIAGAVARRIVCDLQTDQIIQRGQRIGMIKVGSAVELYIPTAMNPTVRVHEGMKVTGGVTILATYTPLSEAAQLVRDETDESERDAADVQASAVEPSVRD